MIEDTSDTESLLARVREEGNDAAFSESFLDLAVSLEEKGDELTLARIRKFLKESGVGITEWSKALTRRRGQYRELLKQQAAEEQQAEYEAARAEREARDVEREEQRARITEKRPELRAHFKSARQDKAEFSMTPGAIVVRRTTGFGTEIITLLRASVAIVRVLVLVDAAGQERQEWELEAYVGDAATPMRLTVSGERFAHMEWVAALGPRAAMAPGASSRDLLRAGIQLLSGNPQRVVVHTSSGWKKHDGRDVYAHAAGAIGAGGVEPGVTVRLPPESPTLARFVLPAPPTGQALIAAVRASCGLLSVAHEFAGFALLGHTYRAALGWSPTTLYLSAPMHSGKTLLAALGQMHYGAGLDDQHPPASWHDATEKALNKLRGTIGDALFLVDDFFLAGTNEDGSLEKVLGRAVRAQHDGSVRAALKVDGDLRGSAPVRSSLLVTGESLSRGHSLRSRCVVVQLSKRIESDLSPLREQGQRGAFAAAMAAFVQWIASQRQAVEERRETFRAEVASGLAREGIEDRTAKMVAEIAVGVMIFLEFALDVGAIDASQHDAEKNRAAVALLSLAREQRGHAETQDPARRFLELLNAALLGGRCHVVDGNGKRPIPPEAWGWIEEPGATNPWRPRGDRVGWLEGDALYIIPAVALAQVRTAAGADPFAVSDLRELARRLHTHGALVKTDLETRGTFFVRKHGIQALALSVAKFRPTDS